ncbi:hypothetical protein HRR83_000119 [Exophiala dermatitidis]|uniref:Uncharacterized protein n=1 Tax=Exophiala dermatitidis TaxID=5970 RepID=A0AAN6F0R2_EXODE|nr:hypothetical protein HRR73_002654 [Exophiala dermatitidis]KAJ4527367.1 hypothetical protein HRR74_000120 [Exophiala dermatitidis]KAJ4530927.1 hypothetical protein HRR76_008616 [Exophiala dermatitidis]KAJ4558099.1 hypothetical protein HRR77_000121 [Exophiala dermatitidis]KAJ4581873.1 hypothetical protein HRR79_000878 [Exophiala dermatitidis]
MTKRLLFPRNGGVPSPHASCSSSSSDSLTFVFGSSFSPSNCAFYSILAATSASPAPTLVKTPLDRSPNPGLPFSDRMLVVTHQTATNEWCPPGLAPDRRRKACRSGTSLAQLGPLVASIGSKVKIV